MRIIHLSDVHFGANHAFTRGGKTNPHALADALATLKRSSSDERCDLVVISGDIVWSCAKNEYEEALVFCKRLRGIFGAELIITPGNHDVDRNGHLSEDARQDNYIEFLRQLYDSAFLSRHYPFLDSPDTSLRRRQQLTSVYRDEEREVVVVSVNSAAQIQGWTSCKECRCRLPNPTVRSCAKCGQVPVLEEPSILIEPEVAHELDKLVPPPNEDRSLRVFVLHHNLFPFTEPENRVESMNPGARPDATMLANSARVQAWLAQKGFHLVLHGHKHQPHGRYDALLRRDDAGREVQRVAVLGAGSAGVYQMERGTEPLGFFVIDCDRLSNQRFQIRTSARKIQVSDLVPRVVNDFTPPELEVGPSPPAMPIVFYAERMTDCHAAIFRQTHGRDRLWRNFVSIVDSTEFELPPTARLEGAEVRDQDVEASFCALHPEFDPHSGGWGGDLKAVHKRLASIRPRFRFQHGPRIFGSRQEGEIHERDQAFPGSSPIERALRRLKQRPDTSHAFIGLFNSPVDLVTEIDQPPALTGIQFSIGEARSLDITFMFRKLDLSFWWVVNMLEAIRLWKWAKEYLQNKHLIARGRITFLATLAEWKEKGSSATFKIDLDEKPIEALVEVVLRADRGDAVELLRLLKEKRERTNQNNIDAEGLDGLIRVIQGVLRASQDNPSHLKPLLLNLNQARDALREAEHQALTDNSPAVDEALRKTMEHIQQAEGMLAGA